MSKRDSHFHKFNELLEDGGPVAITIKQSLWAANDDDPVIFPPTYPLTTFKGRVHTVRDGDYRVSVELPPDGKREKGEGSANQTAGYNIDRFPDGTNSCEIDSPQSQANRIEPMFKTRYHELVPQIEIAVGTNGAKMNLLVEAGHRAADAVVRMSSLADKFHSAFLDVRSGNHFTLATLAPTSLLFGVWDSRSTNVKLQRIIKAQIRATNVYERTRSAQFTPAANYVALGAVDEDLDPEKGDNALSEEGMKHALAIQTAGGVMLTKASEVVRTVNVNLAALREIRGPDADRTLALRSYILGLALVAAVSDPDLNLREGCNLRLKDTADTVRLVPRRGDGSLVTFDLSEVEEYAKSAAKEFFKVAGIDLGKKDHLDAKFETGVAEEFLAMNKADRDKVADLGPITAATLRKFKEQGEKPFKQITDQLKVVKETLGRAPRRNQPRVKNLEVFGRIAEALASMSHDPGLPAEVKSLAGELAGIAREHPDSHEAVKTIDNRVKEFTRAQKAARERQEPTSAT